MGSDFAGIVEAVGDAVTNVEVGDEVFGTMDFRTSSAFAEAIVLESRYVVRKPSKLSFSEAACLPIPAMTAWVAILDKAHARPGSRIFINGCGGAVGASAVQLALAQGARVSGSCGPASINNVKAAGVDPVFGYADKDSYARSGKFDAIFDTLGTLSIGEGLSMLDPNGVFVDINPTPPRVVRGMMSGRYRLAFATMGIKHLSAIGTAASEGILRPAVGVEAPFTDAVALITNAELGRRASGRVVLAL
jgi:NADPH:quinone reductase-like Zn-dependent oxidoreductase